MGAQEREEQLLVRIDPRGFRDRHNGNGHKSPATLLSVGPKRSVIRVWREKTTQEVENRWLSPWTSRMSPEAAQRCRDLLMGASLGKPAVTLAVEVPLQTKNSLGLDLPHVGLKPLRPTKAQVCGDGDRAHPELERPALNSSGANLPIVDVTKGLSIPAKQVQPGPAYPTPPKPEPTPPPAPKHAPEPTDPPESPRLIPTPPPPDVEDTQPPAPALADEPTVDELHQQVMRFRTSLDKALNAIRLEREALDSMYDELDKRESDLIQKAAQVGIILTPARNRDKFNRVLATLTENPTLAATMTGPQLAKVLGVSDTLVSSVKRFMKHQQDNQGAKP